MSVIPISTDIRLPDSQTIDLMMLQWHTPTPSLGAPISESDSRRREAELSSALTWLTDEYELPEADRPLFLIFPELSLPRRLIEHVDTALERRDGPTIVVGGLEYIQRSELEDLLSELNLMITGDRVLANIHDGDIVNTALVWIRGTSGLYHCLQPKRHPYEDEATHICRGDYTALFESSEQGYGRRFNFTVHVCSDFNSAQKVLDIRHECEEAKAGTPLDAAFLVEHNQNQNAVQFREAARAYFSPPTGGDPLAQTTGACIVMVNNAAETSLRRGHWGDSQMKYQFCYGVRRNRIQYPSTYFIHDDGAFDTQAAIMRSPGPAAYFLHYRPRSLVSQIPGHDWPEPFFEGPSLHATIDGTPLEFQPLFAVSHWLHCQWLDGMTSLEMELTESHSHLPPDMHEWWTNRYRDAMEVWLETLQRTPTSGRPMIEACLLRKNQPDSPPRETEPERWGSDSRAAMRDFLRFFMLCRLWRLPNGSSVDPAPQGVRHASGPNGERVSFLWGRDLTVRAILRRFIEALYEDPYTRVTTEDIVIIMMGPPRDSPTPGLFDSVYQQYRDISRGRLDSDAITSGGDVVGAASPRVQVSNANGLNDFFHRRLDPRR